MCSSVSLSIVTLRPAGLSVRRAGWPTFITPMMLRIARTNRAMPTTAIASETTMAKVCMDYCSSWGGCTSCVPERVA